MSTHKSSVERPGKGKSLLASLDTYVVVDLETTGFSPLVDEIIEFGAILVVDGNVVDEFSSLANPGKEIEPNIVRITGITNRALSEAPPVYEVLPEFLAFIGDYPIVGHNISFDVNFLYDCAMRYCGHGIHNDFIDTARLARRSIQNLPNHKLCTLLNYFGIENKHAHSAYCDAQCTYELYERLKPYFLYGEIIEESHAFGGYTYETVYNSILRMLREDDSTVTLRINKNNASIYMFGSVAFSIRINSRTRCLESYSPVAISYVDRIPGASVAKDESVRFPIATSKDVVPVIEEMVNAVYEFQRDELRGEPFGCCNDFVRCSDALKCLHVGDRDYAGCMYRKNLESGRIFYGKNKNI